MDLWSFGSNYFIFLKIFLSLRTSYKELIWCTNDPNTQIRTFCKHWRFIWRYLFPVSILKPLSYCFKETVGFDVKASFASPPVLSLVKPGNITKEFQEKVVQFHGRFDGWKLQTALCHMLQCWERGLLFRIRDSIP